MKLPIGHPLSRAEQETIAAEGIDSWNAYLRRFPRTKDRDRDRALVEWSGEGSVIRNIYGEEYIDCLGGYGIFSLGHRHPEVVRAVKDQLDRMPLHSQYLVNPITAEAGRNSPRWRCRHGRLPVFSGGPRGPSGCEGRTSGAVTTRYVPAQPFYGLSYPWIGCC